MIQDGCSAHDVSPDAVVERWLEAEVRDTDEPLATVAMCACCLGPSRLGYDYCRRCG